MNHRSNFTAIRATAIPTPFPDWTRVKVTARLGLNVAESINFRRPGGRAYSTYAGPMHDATISDDERLHRATIDAADATLYRGAEHG